MVIDFRYLGLFCCDVFAGWGILCIFVGGLRVFLFCAVRFYFVRDFFRWF